MKNPKQFVIQKYNVSFFNLVVDRKTFSLFLPNHAPYSSHNVFNLDGPSRDCNFGRPSCKLVFSRKGGKRPSSTRAQWRHLLTVGVVMSTKPYPVRHWSVREHVPGSVCCRPL